MKGKKICYFAVLALALCGLAACNSEKKESVVIMEAEQGTSSSRYYPALDSAYEAVQGEAAWNDFCEKSEAGEECQIEIRYMKPNGDTDNMELSYTLTVSYHPDDGYTAVYYDEDGTEHSETYPYMNVYNGYYYEREYILVEDEDMDYTIILRKMLESDLSKEYPRYFPVVPFDAKSTEGTE